MGKTLPEKRTIIRVRRDESLLEVSRKKDIKAFMHRRIIGQVLFWSVSA